jgi:hypothetical protein
MPRKTTFCRDLRSGKIIHFCRKTGQTRQIATMDGSQIVVENREVYYHIRSFSGHRLSETAFESFPISEADFSTISGWREEQKNSLAACFG